MDSMALVLKLESTIAASLTISSIALTNRFSTFSLGSPVSYSSNLAFAYDPFVGSSQKLGTLFIKYDQPSTYVVVPYFQHLFSIEMNCAFVKFPGQLALIYFPPNFHWILEHPSKNLSFYTNILLQKKICPFQAHFIHKIIFSQCLF